MLPLNSSTGMKHQISVCGSARTLPVPANPKGLHAAWQCTAVARSSDSISSADRSAAHGQPSAPLQVCSMHCVASMQFAK
jgi:hypothetical protein